MGTAFAGTQFARPLTPADIPGGSFTVFTDANGMYQFNPIPPGLYSISEAQPAGFLDGAEQNGDPSAPAPGVGNDVFTNLVLAPFPVRGPFNFDELLLPVVPVAPVTPPLPLPVAQIDKSLFLSSTLPVAATPASLSPQFVNSVARLGVASNVASIDDIITSAGPGAGPHVKAFDGATGRLLLSFFAYAPGYLGGVNVAVADTNGDGFGEVVAVAASGSSSHVVVREVSGAGRQLYSFLAWPDYRGNGLRVTSADINGDRADDLILGAGPGGATRVSVLSGRSLAPLDDFFAFDPAGAGGVFVG